MDFIYTVGQYVLASSTMNTCGVQLEDGYILDADLRK